MHGFLWLALMFAAAFCVASLTMILRSGREKLKSRRRKEHVRKWVQSETAREARSVSAQSS
jgi:hypothetical protein